MIVLSIDSAGEGCAVCVWRDGQIASFLSDTIARGQDSRLVPMVQAALAQAHTTFESLDRIAATKGPGSYTGLRIGLATARSIGLAANVPVLGIDRFMIYRAPYADMDRDILIVLDSCRDELYTQAFPRAHPALEPQVMTAKAVQEWCQQHENGMILGNASGILASCIASTFFASVRQAEVITAADLAAHADKNDPVFTPRPFYLRYPDVTVCPEC